MLTRITIFFLPFVMVTFGALMLLFGIGIMLEPEAPVEPVKLTMQELLDTQVFDLPQWISVSDAEPDWINSTTVKRESAESGDSVGYETQIVPLKGIGDASTAYVVHYDWTEFSRQFRPLADAIEAGSNSDDVSLPTLGTLQFSPQNAGSKYLFGIEREVIAELHEQGFDEVQVIEPGSRPATTVDAIGISFGGIVGVTLGVFWIRIRRRRKAREDLQPKADLAGLENAACLGASRGVEQAITGAMGRR